MFRGSGRAEVRAPSGTRCVPPLQITPGFAVRSGRSAAATIAPIGQRPRADTRCAPSVTDSVPHSAPLAAQTLCV